MILAICSMLLIIPIYVITVNKCLIKKNNKINLLLSIFFNPTLIYILTFLFEGILSIVFKLEINSIIELICMIISFLICLFGFIYLFDRNKKNIGLDCFIYISFILIEFTCISTVLIDYSFFEALLTCIILPICAYICYYFIITKRLKAAIHELDSIDSIIINLLPCIACIIILIISSIGNNYIDVSNKELYYSFCKQNIFINYLILIFEFFSYYIIFNNIEKKYHLKLITNQVIKNQEQVIYTFCKIIENSNRETGKHVKRVAEYSKILALELGLSKCEAENIKMASMLHDVGKIYIPNEILDKPGKLTNKEWDIIKTHVIKGEQLLHEVEGNLMNLAKKIALEHHEKWNGTGYLEKKEEEIFFPARIVAVADVFDSLVSKRSYKESWPTEKAYNLIINESGKHFDPKVVIAFEKSYNKLLEVYYSNLEH